MTSNNAVNPARAEPPCVCRFWGGTKCVDISVRALPESVCEENVYSDEDDSFDVSVECILLLMQSELASS